MFHSIAEVGVGVGGRGEGGIVCAVGVGLTICIIHEFI